MSTWIETSRCLHDFPTFQSVCQLYLRQDSTDRPVNTTGKNCCHHVCFLRLVSPTALHTTTERLLLSACLPTSPMQHAGRYKAGFIPYSQAWLLNEPTQHPVWRGMGRLWPSQGLPIRSCHGMVDTSHGVDVFFLSPTQHTVRVLKTYGAQDTPGSAQDAAHHR